MLSKMVQSDPQLASRARKAAPCGRSPANEVVTISSAQLGYLEASIRDPAADMAAQAAG
jgi:hypothetical protein